MIRVPRMTGLPIRISEALLAEEVAPGLHCSLPGNTSSPTRFSPEKCLNCARKEPVKEPVTASYWV